MKAWRLRRDQRSAMSQVMKLVGKNIDTPATKAPGRPAAR